ncbi:methionine ABC transporter ATP-binding protein [Propioniferax innocua]|uniref:D-methionine transport system ATP-binding protein n=1 Tax=Propioniferax innocua TaxID=1753 RepID=A0A542Z8N2_9ACTN|nr:methionine ABC transporter ATP-binding protein [Propioniferax innocua]TQL56550.1 D-methionine transport system ATP-binding protein [Propioniferax innocua]
MIELSGVSKTFPGRRGPVHAVDSVDLSVPKGTIHGVVGQSGAGKSTLIRCVNMLERPDAGSVQVSGQELTTLSPAALRTARRHIGMIFQHFNLLSSRTVAGNIALSMELAGIPARPDRIEELAEIVGLHGRLHEHPSRLSGGQKQRVGIARALATNPAVLLADEATSALDPATTDQVLALLRRLNAQLGLTILLITHEMGVVRNICQSASLMENGRLVESGVVADLVGHPGSVLAERLFPLVTEESPDHGWMLDLAITSPLPVGDLSLRHRCEVTLLAGSVEQRGGTRGRVRILVRGVSDREAFLDDLKRVGAVVNHSHGGDSA